MEPRAGFEPAISSSLAPQGRYQGDALARLSHQGKQHYDNTDINFNITLKTPQHERTKAHIHQILNEVGGNPYNEKEFSHYFQPKWENNQY